MVWYCECSQWQLFTNGQISTYRTCSRDAHITQSCRNKPVPCLVWCLQQCNPGAHAAFAVLPASFPSPNAPGKASSEAASSFFRTRSTGRTATPTGDGWHRSPWCTASLRYHWASQPRPQGMRGTFLAFLTVSYTVTESYTKSFFYKHVRLKSKTPDDGKYWTNVDWKTSKSHLLLPNYGHYSWGFLPHLLYSFAIVFCI